jgi:hypothetical protein
MHAHFTILRIVLFICLALNACQNSPSQPNPPDEANLTQASSRATRFGDACTTSADCPASAPFCVAPDCKNFPSVVCMQASPNQRFCSEGAFRQPCVSYRDCSPTLAPFCIKEQRRGQTAWSWCQDGMLYSPCRSGEDCISKTCDTQDHTCFGDDIGHGRPCNSNTDCPSIAPFCVDIPANPRCLDGLHGAECARSSDCSPLAPVCREGFCSSGQAGETCTVNEGCSNNAPNCVPASGRKVCAPICKVRADCPASVPNCVNNQCSPLKGSLGSKCSVSDDCLAMPPEDNPGTGPFCAMNICTRGYDADPCQTDADCLGWPLRCGGDGKDPSIKNICTRFCFTSRTCAAEAPICKLAPDQSGNGQCYKKE